MNRKVRVGINGYGVIGKRVADAVALQDDMEVVGVTFNHFDYRICVAAEKGFGVFAASTERIPSKDSSQIEVRGTLNDLIANVDVMVDCTAKGVAARNKTTHDKAGIRPYSRAERSMNWPGSHSLLRSTTARRLTSSSSGSSPATQPDSAAS